MRQSESLVCIGMGEEIWASLSTRDFSGVVRALPVALLLLATNPKLATASVCR